MAVEVEKIFLVEPQNSNAGGKNLDECVCSLEVLALESKDKGTGGGYGPLWAQSVTERLGFCSTPKVVFTNSNHGEIGDFFLSPAALFDLGTTYWLS